MGRRFSNGNQAFFCLICIDTTKYVLLSFITLLEPICPKNWAKNMQKVHFWLTRLQNSPYFCVFKYARAVKRACEARALRARKTLTPRLTDFFTDFEKKNDCFAVYWLTCVAQKRLCLKGPCQEDIAVLGQFCDEVITAAHLSLP